MLLITNLLLTILTVFTPLDVHNPQSDCASCFVSDAAQVLSPETVNELNNHCYKLKQEVGVEYAIVIVDSIDGDDETAFAEKLFNHWGIGNSNNNSGVLLLYVTSMRAVRFQTGAGIEGLLPDAYFKGLLEEKMFPLMREDKPDEAFLLAMTDMEERLTSEEARQELFVEHVEERGFWWNVLIVYLMLAFIALVVLAIWFYCRTKRILNDPALDNGKRFEAMYSLRQVLWVFSFIFPFPVVYLLFYMFRFRRSLRYAAPVCGLCGIEMKVLSEDEEDAYLNENQQAEENIHSVDYDVWVCPQCGAKKIFSYRDSRSDMYKKCPECGSHSYHMVRETVIVPPTPVTNGKGVKIYCCDVCKTEKRVEFVIPKTPLFVPAGTCRPGGGSMGGGFGGGFTAGGGAGGHF